MRLNMIKEFEQEQRLWIDCFFDAEEYTDYYFREKTRDNKILRMYKENELVSMVHLNPYEICWKGRIRRLYYIVGVCTDKNHRKKGYMRKLLKEAFKLMEEEGCPLTYLMPAKKEIYEPFDFHFIYTQKRLQGRLYKADLKAAQLPKPGGEEIRSVPYKNLTVEKKEEAAAFQNQKLAEAFDLYAIRDAAYLERLSKEMRAAGGELLVFFKEERIWGTVAYMAEIKGEEGVCEVAEGIFAEEHTKKAVELLEAELLKNAKSWKVDFLETGFWKEKEILTAFEEVRSYEKPIIMAKVLETGEKKEELERELREARVYLNEIV